MYSFSGVTGRIRDMREKIRDRVVWIDAERAYITTEAHKKYSHIVPIIHRPMITKEVCEQMTCRVEDFELIVGNKGAHFCGAGTSSEWKGAGWVLDCVDSGEWSIREDGMWHNPDNEELQLKVDPKDVAILREIDKYWKGKTISTVSDAWQPDHYAELSSLECCDYLPNFPLMEVPCGHLIPGYQKILNVGYKAIHDEAQNWIDAHYGNLMGEDLDKFMFYKSVTIATEAAMILVKRYGDACIEKSKKCTDEKRKNELLKMADGLYSLSENPARNFWEACQGIIMYALFLALDSNYPAIAFGRFDQYTWPFLKKDLEEGSLTKDEAQEIVDAFFLKGNCFYNGMPGKAATTVGIGNTYQHTTISGVIPATGEDATNPVTYMVLETLGRLKLHDPTVSMRVHSGTPDELWECALETTKLVGGLPLFQNDEVIVPGLMRELGFSLEDARDYGIIGCQEIVGCGTDYPAPNGIHPPHCTVYYPLLLDMAINNGINPKNGVQSKLHTGYLYEMDSFSDVLNAVEKMVRYILKMHVSTANYIEYLSKYHAPHAGLSFSMEGCMESGKDCTNGGAKYNSYGGTATGLATVADSLSTIKYMVYDKKLCTAQELLEAVNANWEGFETLRSTIVNKVPHFGNNDPYADELMTWICDIYYQVCKECYSTRSKHYKAGMYGASDHVAQGFRTWATPDGRHFGDPIADAASPAQGRDKKGPTAVFSSSCCHDHTRYMDGLALNVRISPSAVKTDSDIHKLRDLTKAYLFAGKGMEVQYNIVSSEDMRRAQDDPDAYRNLVVRIAGYSAYFVELNRDCQNDLISRTENSI